ncbi:MAG: hypothetical protein JSW60_08290 [Thermoplasmatales archaeon]|nr:MAG: hypothetical protein JSW60_08290 [Thermoplasmatales archaeon]
MKNKYILIILALLLFAVVFFRPKRREGTPINYDDFLFFDDYEENPIINPMTREEWDAMIDNTKVGRYQNDNKHWLERGWVNDEWQYRFDTRSSTATVNGEISHQGKKSAEITIPTVPAGYLIVGRYLARYFRDPDSIFDGIFEVGAWYYIPKDNFPILYLSMEDHPTWTKFYIINIALDTSDGTLFVYYTGYNQTLGRIDFQHDSWFKLWIIYNSNEKTFTCGYVSTSEEKTFHVEKPWIGHYNYAYIGYSAYNFYAGGNNLSHDASQTLYIDEYYVKIVERS